MTNTLNITSRDATVEIQRAFNNAGGESVAIPYRDEPYIVRPLTLPYGLRLDLLPGCLLEAAKEGYEDATASVLNVGDYVTIEAYSAVVRMDKNDYEDGEWRHGVKMWGSQEVTISGLTVEGAGGDGFYVGPTWDDSRVPCRYIYIIGCEANNCLRQGLSIVSCMECVVDDLLVLDNGAGKGVPPKAGIAIEPSASTDIVDAIDVANSRFFGGYGSGIFVNLDRLDDTSQDVSVDVRNCYVDQLNDAVVGIRCKNHGSATGAVKFSNCYSRTGRNRWTNDWNTRAGVVLTRDTMRWSKG